jgi:hypothetical protein
MQYMQTGGNVGSAQLINLPNNDVRLPISRPIQQITRPADCRVGEHSETVGDCTLLLGFGF